MKRKPTFNDFNEASPKEIQKFYKLDQLSLEKAQREVLYGASQNDIRKEYEKFYRRNRRDA